MELEETGTEAMTFPSRKSLTRLSARHIIMIIEISVHHNCILIQVRTIEKQSAARRLQPGTKLETRQQEDSREGN